MCSFAGECFLRPTIIGCVQGRGSGVAIVVWRRAGSELETLLLRRSLFPPEYEGDWAWGTPGGGRNAAEPPHVAAARELREETGLVLECRPVASGVAAAHTDLEVSVFEAEAPLDAKIELSDEHDQFEWVGPSGLSRCLPSWVSAMYHEVLAELPVDAGRSRNPGQTRQARRIR